MKYPASVAPMAASRPDSTPSAVNSARMPRATVLRLAPSVRSMALS